MKNKFELENLKVRVLRSLFLMASSVFSVFLVGASAAIANPAESQSNSALKKSASVQLEGYSANKPAEKMLLAGAEPVPTRIESSAPTQPNGDATGGAVHISAEPLIAQTSKPYIEEGPSAPVTAVEIEETEAVAEITLADAATMSVPETLEAGATSPNTILLAQSEATDTLAEDVVKTADAVDSTHAEDLQIPSRFGASFSTSSAGFDEIVGVNAFVPLSQTAGDAVTFLEGSLQLNDGDLGLSLNVGYRNYDLEDDLINGGYLGVDSRSVESTTFYQVAAGYEHIEKDWELRLNGYLPVGDRTSTIQNIDTDTGLQTSTSFEGNELVLSAVRERQRILQQENALGGLDLEVGTQIDEWFGGELSAFIGAYWLSGSESSLGGQARLAANFNSNFNAGLSYQYDDLFGSSVGFSVSTSLPGRRFHGDGERSFQAENEVAIRLRDPIVRRPNVAVNVITERESFFQEDIAALRNPEEEEDYRFVHVVLADGTGSGDGTAESPFGSVEDAIALIDSDADTYSDGNTIVYVDGENALTANIPGFTVPDQVRVLSQGPEQTIAGMSFPGFPTTATRLPFSNEQNFNVTSDEIGRASCRERV